jgi:4-amino-4-deoxy-L-arabinose transferase-like glycosyltransferase
VALSLAGLAALMAHRGHLAVGVLAGLVLTFFAALGLLGLLGDSPLDLRGDERQPAADRPVWWQREGAWVAAAGALLYLPKAGTSGLWDPWETHYSEVAREILARDDWITLWWGQEGWFMSKPILIFWMSALGMGFGSLFGLRIEADSGPQWQEWCIRVPISLLAIGALYALYRGVAGAWGRRAGLLVALVLATMPHWFFLAHQAMTDMPFVAPLTIAMAMLMRAVTVPTDAHAEARRVSLGPWTFRVSLWHLTVGAFLLVALPQVMYLLTRPMVAGCPQDARLAQCQEMLAMNRLGAMQFPVESYYYGSAGNSGPDLASSVPGSPGWERLLSVVPFFPSVVQGVLWTLLGGAALWLLRRERRQVDLYFVLMFFWCAVSTMGKGPAGLAIPVGVAGLFLVTSRTWNLLPRARIGTGLMLFCAAGLPWYVAILGRLGNEFFDRFIVHDLINRTFAGVHGDTGTFRYFVWQLGYAMFPWTGLVPSALVAWRHVVPASATVAQRRVARLGMLWFLVAFYLFSAMITKFHHYIFPAVPGAAVMVGLLLHRMLEGHDLRRARNPAASLAALVGGVLSLVLGVANFFGSPRGLLPRRTGAELPPGSVGLGVGCLLLGAWLLYLAWRQGRGSEPEDPAAEVMVSAEARPQESALLRFFSAPIPRGAEVTDRAYDPVAYGAMGLGAAAVLAFVARDLGYTGSARPPGYQRLLQLFTYQYERQWPVQSFDYHAILIGFGAVAVTAAVALAVHRLRAHAARALVVVGFLFAAWCLDVYMIDVGHHWSQRDLFVRYFARRAARAEGEEHFGEDARYRADPCGAYMMNWKGENFYTGGHCAMLDCGELPFCSNHARQWLEQHRGQRVFFVTEHPHGGSIMAHVRASGGEAHTITDEYMNNKFVLIEARVGNR